MRIEYYDASLPETRTKFADVTQQAETRRLAYPLILLNGDLKSSGGVDTYQLMFLVDQHRKDKGLPGRF